MAQEDNLKPVQGVVCPWGKGGEQDPIDEKVLLETEQAWLDNARPQQETRPGAVPERVGLALSGGGIRSATFNLGVLQALAALKDQAGRSILHRMDYLCTVSGGGYIGGWLVANLWKRMRKGAAAGGNTNLDFLESHSREVLHLRRHSRYLAPEAGLLNADTWTMVATWLRNTALIQLMVGCWVMAVMLAVRLMSSLFDFLAGWDSPKMWAAHWIWQGLDVSSEWIKEHWHPMNGWMSLFLAMVFLILAWRGLTYELGERKLKVKPRGQKWMVLWVVLPLLSASYFIGAALSGEMSHELTFEVPAFIYGDEQAFMLCAWLGYRLSLAGASAKDANPSEAGADRDENAAHAAEARAEMWRRWAMVVGAVMLACLGSFFISRAVAAGAPDTDFDWNSTWGRLVRLWSLWIEPAVWGLVVLRVGWKFVHSRPWWIYLMAVVVAMASCLYAKWAATLMKHVLTGALFYDYLDAAAVPSYLEVARLYVGPAVLMLGSLWVVLVIGLLGRDMKDNVREWLSRLGAWLTIAWMSWLVIKVIVFHGPGLVYWIAMTDLTWVKWGSVLGWFGGTLGGILAGNSGKTNGATGPQQRKVWVEWFAIVGPYIALLGLLLGSSWLTNYLVNGNGYWAGAPGHVFTRAAFPWLLLLLASGFVLIHRVDLNEFSMNHFYRNRLVRCYLGGARPQADDPEKVTPEDRAPEPFTGFDFADDFYLSSLGMPEMKYRGPYPIICGALNTSNGGGLDTQERKAESFIFTPLACGASRENAPRTEGNALHSFRPTPFYADGGEGAASWEEIRRPAEEAAVEPVYPGEPLKLGTCMSISGAAVNPNWGYHTSSVTSLMLTLFNVRLGWWLPNAAHTKNGLHEKKPWRRSYPGGFWGWLSGLVGELSGSASPVTSFINVSDGGHFENLGVYELVRRRCSVIICGDGEQDGEYGFHGLGTAIRRCRVDFRTNIAINLSEVKPAEVGGLCKVPYAVGRIEYPDRAPGILIYLKLSYTGRECADVAQYRALHPAFPHESTGDQFFTESQFESYRCLGQAVAMEALSGVWNKSVAANAGKPEDTWKEFLKTLQGG